MKLAKMLSGFVALSLKEWKWMWQKKGQISANTKNAEWTQTTDQPARLCIIEIRVQWREAREESVKGRRYKECRILGGQSNIKGGIERERWCVGEWGGTNTDVMARRVRFEVERGRVFNCGMTVWVISSQ
jgi:hypothetical protein